MYCPRCGQQQSLAELKFCSRCGFLMSGMSEVVSNGGLPKAIIGHTDPQAISPRRRGLKQGGLLFLSGTVIVPILGVFTAMVNGEGYVAGIAAILTFLAGFVRMLYALVFQSGVSTLENESLVDIMKDGFLSKKSQEKALPPQQSDLISTSFQPPAGHWRETADLQPGSVTEETTKTLNNKTFN